MRLATLKPEYQRAMAIGVPLLVLLLVTILIVPRVLAIWKTEQLLAARRAEAAQRAQQEAAELATLTTRKLPAQPEGKGEELAFLRQLNRMMVATGVHLVSYRPATAASGGAGKAAPVPGHSRSIQPVAADVTASGSFVDLVSLFRALSGSDRLFAVENLQMRTEAYPRLSATFRLVRYVTPLHGALVSRLASRCGPDPGEAIAVR